MVVGVEGFGVVGMVRLWVVVVEVMMMKRWRGLAMQVVVVVDEKPIVFKGVIR